MDNFLIGTFVGFSQTLVGHPIETLKMRVQTNMKVRVPIRTLFNGISIPFCLTGFANSLFFGIENHFYKKGYPHWQAGAIAGFSSTFIVCPLENIKVKKQVSHDYNLKFYRGIVPFISRETISMSIYFGSYNKFKDLGMNNLLAGAITGWLSWLPYPFDVIKSRMQQNYSISLTDAVKQKKMWKGFGICSIRAIIVNAIGFATYEIMSKHIKEL